MKKVYIPTQEELADMQIKMQATDSMIYRYLMAKIIETLIMEDVMYEETDMFDVAYEQFADYPEIRHGLAKLYPEKISGSKYASNDSDLCSRLITDWTINSSLTTKMNANMQHHPICNLNNLLQFSESTLQNPKVMEATIIALGEKLHLYPKYRFNYEEPNILLDAIFSGEILDEFPYLNQIATSLSNIDPIFDIKIRRILENREQNQIAIDRRVYSSDEISDVSKRIFYSACGRFIHKYITEIYNPYRLGEEYPVKNLDIRTKKLVRYLNDHKNNCQS